MRIRKRERIDTWIRDKKIGYRFYANQIGDSLGLTTMEVVVYLKWHTMVKRIGDSMKEPNWVVVRGVKG